MFLLRIIKLLHGRDRHWDTKKIPFGNTFKLRSELWWINILTWSSVWLPRFLRRETQQLWRGVTELRSLMDEHRSKIQIDFNFWKFLVFTKKNHFSNLIRRRSPFSLLSQVVTYEVHPVRGYEAKVSYEGTAQVWLLQKCRKVFDKYFLQYPDSPDFVPSPYGPPEPVKQGERKFKRQSRPVVVVDDSNRFNVHKDEDATVISVNFVTNHINLVTIFGISRLSILAKKKSANC